jgi:hypothetical protein
MVVSSRKPLSLAISMILYFQKSVRIHVDGQKSAYPNFLIYGTLIIKIHSVLQIEMSSGSPIGTWNGALPLTGPEFLAGLFLT